MGLNDRQPNANFLSIKHHSICKEWKPSPSTDEERAEAIAAGFKEMTVQNPSDPKGDGTFGTVQKWVRKFGSLDGQIIGLQWYDREYSGVRYMGLKVKIKDKETYILNLPFASKGYDVFTRVMEDINYERPIEISVWKDTQSKRANAPSAVLFRQDGESIKWRYTKEYNNHIVQALGAKKETEQLAVELSDAFDAQAVPGELIEKVRLAGFAIVPSPVHNPLAKPQWNFDAQRAFLWRILTEHIIPEVERLNPKFDDPRPEYGDTSFDPEALEGTEATAAPPPLSIPASTAASAPAAAKSGLPEFTGPQPPATPAGAAAQGWTPPPVSGTSDDVF